MLTEFGKAWPLGAGPAEIQKVEAKHENLPEVFYTVANCGEEFINSTFYAAAGAAAVWLGYEVTHAIDWNTVEQSFSVMKYTVPTLYGGSEALGYLAGGAIAHALGGGLAERAGHLLDSILMFMADSGVAYTFARLVWVSVTNMACASYTGIAAVVNVPYKGVELVSRGIGHDIRPKVDAAYEAFRSGFNLMLSKMSNGTNDSNEKGVSAAD